jgi:hypothetical protein
MTPKSLSFSFWLGRWLKSENACTVDSLAVPMIEGNYGGVPMVKHEMASVLRVGWNANHESSFGLLDRTIVHVDKRRI